MSNGLRWKVCLLVILGVVAGTVSGANAARSVRTYTVTMGQAAYALTYIADYVASDEGFYAKHGITVQRTTISNTSAAMIAGSVDVANQSSDQAIIAAGQGKPLPTLLVYNQHSTHTLVIRTDADSPLEHRAYPLNILGIARPFTVGVSALGGGSYAYAEAILQGAGLKEGQDYTLVALGAGGNFLRCARGEANRRSCRAAPI